MILENIVNQKIDLSISEKFRNHIQNPGTYTDFLVWQLNQHNFRNFLLHKKDINVLDLGGNIGLWSLYLAPICKNIITVEPTPSHCEVALEIFNSLNKENNITLFNCAISDLDGFKNFNIGIKNSTMNSLHKYQEHDGIIKIQTFKLKTFIKAFNFKIDFLKIDIEGSEKEVILNSDFDSFIYDNVESIYLETHESLGAPHEEICKKLKSLNYILDIIKHDTIYAHK